MRFEELARSIAGTVVTRGDERYEDARRRLVWNARRPGRFPDAIVRADSAADVRAVVRFARARGLRVSPRSGGHHWSGVALPDGGIALDLGALDGLRLDPRARLAVAGPAVTGRRLANALGDEGLAFPVGHCPTVPLGGYLLGGGFGWNAGAWGVACFHVEEADVVLADGSSVRASEHENPDVFWAVRGSGPEFFGIVTEWRLRAEPLPRAIRTSVWTYALARVADVEAWISAAVPTLPRNVELTLTLGAMPPSLAERAARAAIVVATVFADGEAEAASTLDGLAALAPAGALATEPNLSTPFETLFGVTEGRYVETRRFAADTFWSDGPAGRFFATLAERIADAPAPESLALGLVLPPPDAPLPDAAFSRVAPVYGAAYAVWREAADDEANLAWFRDTAAALAPMTTGAYLGEADLENPARTRSSFSPAAWEKLGTLRRRYDPEGTFRSPVRENDRRSS